MILKLYLAPISHQGLVLAMQHGAISNMPNQPKTRQNRRSLTLCWNGNQVATGLLCMTMTLHIKTTSCHVWPQPTVLAPRSCTTMRIAKPIHLSLIPIPPFLFLIIVSFLPSILMKERKGMIFIYLYIHINFLAASLAPPPPPAPATLAVQQLFPAECRTSSRVSKDVQVRESLHSDV